MNYWEECILEAFEDAGIVATKDQVSTVTNWVSGAHENYGMAFGHDSIPSYYEQENKVLIKELEKERKKVICDKCKGSGNISTYGPYHSSFSTCYKCKGEGRV
jgi:hypothetical protein